MDKTVSAVIAAAGASARMGFDKLAFRLGRHTVLEQSVLAFDQCTDVDEIILVAGEDVQNIAHAAAAECRCPVHIVLGGATRAESVKVGVEAARGQIVAIHDAARPFVSAEVIARVLRAAADCGAAAPAVPVKDTIKCASAGNEKCVPDTCFVQNTPQRRTLYAVQTPQCFDRLQYLQALKSLPQEKARLVTDDCSLFELAGLPVQLVQGDYANLKITTPEDLAGYMRKEPTRMRIGHGYDVHQLTEGRRLILGGAEVPYSKGLLGHSDADVLTHAVMDALLGAAALGDIGQHFPDNDPAYAGADSLMLARSVQGLLESAGWQVENIDATLLCQAPKLAPYISAMRQNLADALQMEPQDISIKATTEEHLGFTGQGLGIAAHAVALLRQRR